MTARMSWETLLGCFGYFGFGGGYAAAKEGKDQPGYGLYCNVCPLSQGCWQEHRIRARETFPELMGALDELIEAHPGDGQTAVQRFWERFKYAPPDIAMNGGNVEDGMRVAMGETPKERERATLTWPLARRG